MNETATSKTIVVSDNTHEQIRKIAFGANVTYRDVVEYAIGMMILASGGDAIDTGRNLAQAIDDWKAEANGR